MKWTNENCSNPTLLNKIIAKRSAVVYAIPEQAKPRKRDLIGVQKMHTGDVDHPILIPYEDGCVLTFPNWWTEDRMEAYVLEKF